MTIKEMRDFLSMFPEDFEIDHYRDGYFDPDQFHIYKKEKIVRCGFESTSNRNLCKFLHKFPEYCNRHGYKLSKRGRLILV